MKHFYNMTFLYMQMLILFLYFLVCMCAISCGNSSQKTKVRSKSSLTENSVNTNVLNLIRKEKNDIPVAINISHTEDEDIRQLLDAEYEITLETDDDIYIDINSDYYNRYSSGTRFRADQLAFFEKSENVEYLTVCLDIVNNTNKKISVNELDLKIAESKPDTIPVIYICTTQDQSNSIYFVNESWFDWEGFTFSYSILKKGESFNGNYSCSRYIPYFESHTIVNLLPDMISMGYDYEGLIKNNNGRIYITNDESIGCNYMNFSIKEDDEDFQYFMDKFYPFGLKKQMFGWYVGAATLYGSIKFDNIDFDIDFIAEISLSTDAGFGAFSYENDEFNVKLKSSGSDYMLRYPYTTVIEPYGAEMVKLTITADKSSSHKFFIDIKNDNDFNIRSKVIHFHHYYPKN